MRPWSAPPGGARLTFKDCDKNGNFSRDEVGRSGSILFEARGETEYFQRFNPGNLIYDMNPLSSFAFNLNLRHYSKEVMLLRSKVAANRYLAGAFHSSHVNLSSQPWPFLGTSL